MPKIGRPRAEVVVTDDERVALVRLTKRARVNRAVAFRARIVLACIDASDTAVARRLRTTKTTVAKWRSQFVERRLEGLYDEPRVGAPRTISDEQVEAIIVKTLETTPPRRDALEHAVDGEGGGRESHDGRPHLADVPAAAASHGEFQALAGSATRGEDPGRRRAVHGAAGECRGLLG